MHMHAVQQLVCMAAPLRSLCTHACTLALSSYTQYMGSLPLFTPVKQRGCSRTTLLPVPKHSQLLCLRR